MDCRDQQPRGRHWVARSLCLAFLLGLLPLTAGNWLVAGATAPPTPATPVSTPSGASPEPQLRWSTQLRGPIAAPPAVTTTGVYVGTETGELAALDTATGAVRWQVTLPGPVQTPSVANGLVYVASGRMLVAVTADRGERRWTVTADQILSAPAVASGLVYAGSWGGRVLAVNAATGHAEWQAQTDEVTVLAVPTVAGDTVLVSSERGAVYAVDARTGTRRWRTVTGPGPGPPRVMGAVVYIGSGDGAVVALDLVTGLRRWQVKVAPAGHCCGSPALANGTLYLGLAEGLVALDAATGAVHWRWASGGYQLSSPTYGDRTIYAGGSATLAAHRHAGVLVAVDASTGRERWHYVADDWVSASPVLAGADLIFGTWSGHVISFTVSGA